MWSKFIIAETVSRHVNIYSPTHTHTHVHIHTYIYTFTYIYKHAHARMLAHTCTHTHIYTQSLTYTNTDIIPIHTHTYFTQNTRTHTHTQAKTLYTQVHPHTYCLAYAFWSPWKQTENQRALLLPPSQLNSSLSSWLWLSAEIPWRWCCTTPTARMTSTSMRR